MALLQGRHYPARVLRPSGAGSAIVAVAVAVMIALPLLWSLFSDGLRQSLGTSDNVAEAHLPLRAEAYLPLRIVMLGLDPSTHAASLSRSQFGSELPLGSGGKVDRSRSRSAI